MRKAFLTLLISLAFTGLIAGALLLLFDPLTISDRAHQKGELVVCFKKEIKAEDAINRITYQGDRVNAVLLTDPMVLSVALSAGKSVEEGLRQYENDQAVDFARPNFSRGSQL